MVKWCEFVKVEGGLVKEQHNIYLMILIRATYLYARCFNGIHACDKQRHSKLPGSRARQSTTTTSTLRSLGHNATQF